MLDAYLDRIAVSRPAAPTRDALAELLGAHLRAIPFENLDVLLGRPIELALPAVFDKLVRRRRGGYCFEHATLFGAMLGELGFGFTMHAARVRYRASLPVTPRTHAWLRVEAEGAAYLVDPGFGGPGPQVPVPLRAGASVGDVDLAEKDGAPGTLRRRLGDEVVDLYEIALEALPPIDFVVANHFTSTYPRSPFRQRLMVQRARDDGGVSIANDELSLRSGATVETRTLADRGELRAALREHFGIDLQEAEALVVPAVDAWR